MSLASGHAVTRLVIKTLEDSIRIPALDRMGAVGPDCNCQEVLEFHSDLLLSHVGWLFEVNTYHKSLPWKCVTALRPASLPELLSHMKLEWQFVTECVDKLHEKSLLHKLLAWTRAQPYCEAMVVAESLCFYSSVFWIWCPHPFQEMCRGAVSSIIKSCHVVCVKVGFQSSSVSHTNHDKENKFGFSPLFIT